MKIHFPLPTILLPILFYCNYGFAALVVTAGSDIDIGSGWRTATVSGDIGSDGFLGTDGYRYVTDNPGGNGANDVESVAPAYATLNLTNANFRGNAGYALIDDPDTTPGGTPSTLRSGTFNPQPTPRAEGTFVSFGTIDFTRNANAGEIVRIGIMVDNLDNNIFNSSDLRLTDVSSGTNTDATVFTGTGAGAFRGNRNPDWFYFDVTNFAAGEQIEVFATSSFGNGSTSTPATIGAFSFDSVPEPSSIVLTFVLGFYGLFIRRRRF